MKLLVTAGPTREFIDPVRFVSNRSSGRMGYALAEVAARRGHDVTLVSGPVSIGPPRGVRLVCVVSALDMLHAVEGCFEGCDGLIMCAAVADWRPREVAPRKLKKHGALPALEWVPTPDILSALRPRKGRRVVVGFAAETDNLLSEARAKLDRKGLDLIVANDVSQPDAGFEVATNRVVLVTRDAPPVALPLMSKAAVAERILDWIEARPAPPGAPRGAQ